MFVGGSNRDPLGTACRVITSTYPWCTNPYSMYFWLGFFYNFEITKILVIVVRRGRGNKFLITIICIAIAPVVISVHSCRWFCHSYLSGPWRRGGMQNYGRTNLLSASQYFKIILQGVSLCAACFGPLGRHPCPCTRRARPPLFRFNLFFISLELWTLLDSAIAWDLLDPTLLLSLPLLLLYPILHHEAVTSSFSSPPLSPSSF